MFELTEKKRLVDMHLNIATTLNDRVKQRSLDAYLKLEEAITTNAASVLPLIFLCHRGLSAVHSTWCAMWLFSYRRKM